MFDERIICIAKLLVLKSKWKLHPRQNRRRVDTSTLKPKRFIGLGFRICKTSKKTTKDL